MARSSVASVIFDILVRDRASAQLRGIGSNVDGVAGKLGAMAGALGAGAALKDSIAKASDFDKTIRTIGAATGETAAGMDELRKVALDFGAKTTFSAAGASDAMLELAKGGLTTAQIKAGALAETLTLASAGQLELGTAAGFVVQGLTTFGLRAEDAAQVSAALAGAANASTASVESIGQALSQVGPGAKLAGLSIQETTAALALFDKAGIKGSDAGTSLKTMLTRLVPQTEGATNAMRRLGLDFTDATGAIVPLSDVSEQLKQKLGGLSEEQRTLALSTIFGSDATRAASVLMDQGAAGIESFTAKTSDLAAAQNMAKVGTQGYAGALEKFQGAVETLQIQVGSALLPALASLFTVLADDILPAVESLGGGLFRTLGDHMTLVKIAGGALVIVLGLAAANMVALKVATVAQGIAAFYTTATTYGLSYALTAGSIAAKALAAATWLVNAAMSATPLGIVVKVLALLVGGLIAAYQSSETFRRFVGDAFKLVRIEAGRFVSVIATVIEAVQKIPGFGWAEGAAVSVRKLATELEYGTEKVEGQAEAQGVAKVAADALTTANNDLATAQGNLSTEIDTAISKFTILKNGFLDQETASNGLKDAWAKFSGEIERGGKALDDNTEKGRANRTALQSMAKAIDAKITADFKANESTRGFGAAMDIASGQVDKNRKKLIDVAVQSGISREAAKKYVGQLLKTPDEVRTDVETPGLSKAMTDIAKLQQQLSVLNQTRANPRVTVQTATSYYRQDAAAARRGPGGDGYGIGDGPGISLHADSKGTDTAHADVTATLREVAKRFLAEQGGPGMGYQRQMDVLRQAFPGLPLISGLRPGAITATGNPSYHGKGRAVDIPPDMSVFNWIRANFGSKSKELIFSPAGGAQIHNGRPHIYSGITKAMHYDHIHWAMANGGIIGEPVIGIGQRTGQSYAFGEKGPERVLSNEDTRAYDSGQGRGMQITVRAQSDDSVARAVARRVNLELRDQLAVAGI